ncbi:MAG TPA: class I SAM-dependent methyltransferase, partial [Saprospiraceae bacterium]|nr:class I SAM-dependent methyltransferase [Saprospiraceae bacterium]
ISSAYRGISNTKARIITLKGDPEIALLAKEVHQNLILRNIDIKIGPFSSTLSPALKEIQLVDLAFLDGHHAMEPTLAYYEQLIPFCHDNSIIVIDDIYWSEGMQSAWKNLIERPEVTLSIDLYDVGILFFKKELTKKHVSYIPYKYKPWRIGLFG